MKEARRRGKQKKRWEDNIKEWAGMEFGHISRSSSMAKAILQGTVKGARTRQTEEEEMGR